jgi:stringent starvation protein B
MLSLPDHRSTRPYLIRAMFEWCVDHGFTPYLVVMVDKSVLVPQEFVKNGEIVLNISPEATGNLTLGNEWIEFKARFGGVARDILVPVERVIAIYSKENGQGMAFPKPIEGDKPNSTQAPLAPGQASSKPDKAPWLQVVPHQSSSHPALAPTSAPTDLSRTGDWSEQTSLLDSNERDPSEDSSGPGDEPTPPSTGPEGKSHLKRIK